MEYHRISNTHTNPNKNTNYIKKYMKLYFKMHSIIVSFTCISLLGFEWSNGKKEINYLLDCLYDTGYETVKMKEKQITEY